MFLVDYLQRKTVIRNADIQGAAYAIVAPVHRDVRGSSGPEHGITVIEDSNLIAGGNIGVEAPWSVNGTSDLSVQMTVLRNVRFGHPSTRPGDNVGFYVGNHSNNQTVRNDVRIMDYNTAAGGNGADLYLTPRYQSTAACDFAIGDCSADLAASYTGQISAARVYALRNAPAGVPYSPLGLVAAVSGSTSVDLVWSDISVNESGFKIERKTGTGAFAEVATVAADTRTYRDSSVSPGASYAYRVRAFNSFGNSGYSNDWPALISGAPAALGLSSLGCAPSTVSSGAATICTTSLTAAAGAGGFTVNLTSSNATALPVPPSVVVPTGSTATTFTATAGTVASQQGVTLTASALAVSRTASVTVTPPGTLSSISCSPSSINTPGAANCTVTLSQLAPSAATVTLSSSDANLTTPPSVNVAAGSASATFAATAASVAADVTAQITAGLNGVSRNTTVTLVSPIALTVLSCTPSSLLSGANTTCTATLNRVAGVGGFAVNLTSGNTAALPVPASLMVPSGSASAAFTATAGTVTSQPVTVTASANGVVRTATVTVQPFSMTCTPETLTMPAAANCVITLGAPAPAGGSIFQLASSDRRVTTPSAVTVQSGQTRAGFRIVARSAVSAGNQANVTATNGGRTVSFTLTLN